ncbi:unnamed protein product [Sphagnum jensenii]|uniref:Rhodanese domain-containing protein n=1 Tax=Sphagnum jensenii TaxID=128206 RepID=A0ABP0VGL9_9BRYO
MSRLTPEEFAIKHSPSSIRYDVDRVLAIAPNIDVLLKHLNEVPKDCDFIYLTFDDFDIIRGAIAGRKRVVIFDGGNETWRKAVESLIADMGGHVDLPPSQLIIERGDQISLMPIDWLWNGWLARGKLHMLAGAPGTGKTTIALSLAAILTSGGKWPDGTTTWCCDVIIWSGEDDPADTLAPD